MLAATDWKKNQANTVLFVMVNNSTIEITGLGDEFDVFISKGGAAFVSGVGAKLEVGLGWYSYTATPEEADTSGPIALSVTGSQAEQQNLEYVVEDRVITAIYFTYVVTSTAGNLPIQDVKVSIYADSIASLIVWTGMTDSFGTARDEFGLLPRLEPGTYFFFRDKAGYLFENPDTEVVS